MLFTLLSIVFTLETENTGGTRLLTTARAAACAIWLWASAQEGGKGELPLGLTLAQYTTLPLLWFSHALGPLPWPLPARTYRSLSSMSPPRGALVVLPRPVLVLL